MQRWLYTDTWGFLHIDIQGHKHGTPTRGHIDTWGHPYTDRHMGTPSQGYVDVSPGRHWASNSVWASGVFPRLYNKAPLLRLVSEYALGVVTV